MSLPRPRERLRILRLGVGRRLRAPRLKRRRTASAIGEFLFVPSDLHPADPELHNELRAGQMGIAGHVAAFPGRSPFAVTAAPIAWHAALHGFGWLNHLEAAATPEAVAEARRLVAEWIRLHGGGKGLPWRADVLARRVIAWISHSSLLLEGAEEADYAAVTRSLAHQRDRLDTAVRSASPGAPRLMCHIAGVLAGLAIESRDGDGGLERGEGALLKELGRQILPDGGHVSRNPDVVLDLLAELLPLQRCYQARSRPVPEILATAVARMAAFLHALRLGDGSLARFNGDCPPRTDLLATVLAVAAGEGAPGTLAASRYVRLTAGGTVVIMDCGGPPPLELSGAARAGCLSFEMSDGTLPVLVNTGTPVVGSAGPAPDLRATSRHNTLTLADRSSARLVESRLLARMIGGTGLAGPDTVSAKLAAAETGSNGVEASHDGYATEFGLLHIRRLTLSEDGRRIEATDRLAPRRGALRFARDLPFAIRFHLAPGAAGRVAEDGSTAEIVLANGTVWRLEADGAALTLETIAAASAMGRNKPPQLFVLRGSCPGETTVSWTLERRA